MSSNLKVNTILPSTGTTIGIGTVGGLINVVGNIDVNSTSGISTFNGLEISGIVTAKSGAAVTYYGDGSNLTGISGGVTSDAQRNTVGGTNAGDSFTGTDATDNTIFGYNAGTSLTTGDKNVIVGSYAAKSVTTIGNFVAIGNSAYSSQVSSNGGTVAIGNNALRTYTGSFGQLAIGSGAGEDAGSSGGNNTIVGNNAGYGCKGFDSVIIGYQAGSASNTQGGETIIGKSARYNGNNLAGNTAVGKEAMKGVSGGNGSHTTAIGYEALKILNNGGNQNTALGYQAGDKVNTGASNVIIGYSAASTGTNDLTNGSNNIIIGKEAAATSATVSNEITLGDANITKFRIPGLNFTNDNGRLLLGTTTEGHTSGDNLTIAATDGGPCGITLRSDTDEGGRIFFSDGTSGDAEYEGVIGYDHGSNYMYFSTNHAQKLRIDSNGNTHFGSSGTLNDSNTVSIIPADGRISFGMDGRNSLVTGESGCYIFSGEGSSGSILAGELVLQTRSNQNRDLHFATGATPTMRARFRGVDGDFFLGNDLGSITSVGTAIRENDGSLQTYMEMGHSATGAAYSYFICRHGGGGTNIGGIAQNNSGNGVTFNTSSDYRLKTNEALITDGITKIKQLKPYRFEWKSDLGTKVDGFFAHEVSSIVPEAVTGTKDAVETTYYDDEKHLPEGKSIGDVKETDRPVYQKIDQSKLVPLLTAALQEAITEIETLKTKVAALEGS